MDERDEGAGHKKWQGRLRWILILLLTPASLLFCGQLAWTLYHPADLEEIRSDLTADYSPWQSTFFPGLDPNILSAALRDQDGAGWVEPRRALDCFLLTARCQTAIPEVKGIQGEGEFSAPTPMRIANGVEPDFDQPDGMGLEILPGMEILLDIRNTPILFPGGNDAGADVLFFTIDSVQQEPAFTVSLALKPDGPWTDIYIGGDQTHGDNQNEIPYSNGNGEAGDLYDPSRSSEVASGGQTVGLAVDVDDSLQTPGLYGWMRLRVEAEENESVFVDAIVVIEGDA